MKIICLLFIFVLTSACSLLSVFKSEPAVFNYIENQDYIDHLAATGREYLISEEKNKILLDEDVKKYLEELHERIISSNQSLLTGKDKPEFSFIKHKTPFLFSLPKSQYFFSTGLLERFLKSEEVFIAALSSEILKSHRFIYEKKLFLPTGVYGTEKMLKLTRLKFEDKVQVNEWTYYILKRARFDATAYLNWIQIQSRNTLEFAMYIDDPTSLTREEQQYKNFISKQGVFGIGKKINEANSSRIFYKLLNNIARTK